MGGRASCGLPYLQPSLALMGGRESFSASGLYLGLPASVRRDQDANLRPYLNKLGFRLSHDALLTVLLSDGWRSHRLAGRLCSANPAKFSSSLRGVTASTGIVTSL